jgi:hypothetical protein
LLFCGALVFMVGAAPGAAAPTEPAALPAAE